MKGDFADGLKKMFSKGSLYERTYLTKNMRYILGQIINDTLENTFSIECENQYNQLMKAMTFLRLKLEKNISFKLNLDLEIASVLHHWIGQNKYHHLADNKDFDKAIQWVCNLYCRKYAISDFTLVKFVKK